MAINIGSAVAYLDLDTSNFQKGFKSAANDLKVFLSDTATADQKLKGLGSSMSTVGSILSRNVTVPLLGVGTAAVKVTADFDKQMSSVQAISGATGKQFESLRETAIELGASTSYSASEVAAAMTEMAKAGWDSQQIIDGMSGVLDAAAASGEDLASVGTIVADAITTFGLAASDSTKVADLLTQAANSGTIGISDLAESFKYIGPVANTMGFSIEDVTTAITALSTAGIKGSQAGTTLRSMFARMVKPTDDVAAAMEELNIVLTDSEGNFKDMDTILAEMRSTFSTLTPEQQAYYATVLAGQEGMSGLTTLLGMTQEEYDKIADSMDNADGIAKETAETMKDNLAGALEQLGGALESAAIVIGDRLVPYIRDFAEWITRLIEGFNNLDEDTKDLIVRIGLFVAAIGPGLLILSKLVTVIRTVVTVVSTVTGVLVPAFNAFMLLKAGGDAAMLAMEGFSAKSIGVATALAGITAPVIAVVGVIGTLIAAFVTLWNTSEEFRDGVIGIFESVVASVQSFANGVVERINELGFNFQSITDIIRAIWQSFCDFLAPVFMIALTTIQTVLQTAFDVILGILDIFVGIFTGDWQQAANGAINILTALYNGITTIVSNILSLIVSWGSQLISTAVSVASNFASSFIQFIQELPGRVWGIIKQIPERVRDVGSLLRSAGESIFNSLWDGIKSVGESILGWVSDFASSIGSFVSGIIDGFTSIVSGANEARAAAQSVDGSHANGLAYVPFDGYIAELHKGERVLTADENREYNRTRGTGTGSGDTFNFYNTQPNPYEYARQMKRAKRELLRGI